MYTEHKLKKIKTRYKTHVNTLKHIFLIKIYYIS